MREKLRLAILNAYGIDIDKYKYDYMPSLSAYTIRAGEYTIRVTNGDGIDKNTRLERLKWAQDLKEFKNTVCEPIPSQNGKLLEEIKIGKWSLIMTMHRTARGSVISADEIKPMTLISAGDMLGTMHHMSMQRDSSEEKYKIPTPYVMYENKRKRVSKFLNKELNDRIDSLIRTSFTKEKTLETYGVCYGEFDLHNIIVDTNNIHLFDFDNSIYSHYMYDIASFAVSILSAGYMIKRKSKDIIENTFIPWFRVGYGINKRCDQHTFDDIEFYMGLRGVWIILNLVEQYQVEQNEFLKLQMDAVSEILMKDSIYEGIDEVRKRLFSNIEYTRKVKENM